MMRWCSEEPLALRKSLSKASLEVELRELSNPKFTKKLEKLRQVSTQLVKRKTVTLAES